MAGQTWISQLRMARSHAEQVAALRRIKNEIIGHPLKKEKAVAHGVLESVTQYATNTSSNQQDGKSHTDILLSRQLIEEEVIRLQGLHILASVALGGYAFT